MTDVHVEIERKYDVREAFVLPDLTGVPGVAAVTEPVEHTLQAAYYDTADLRLARARVTLRRRTGGTDAGWHVKLPAAAGARRELQSPLGRAARNPPKAVLAPVLGIVRAAPVTQVARLQTRRVVTELRNAEGRVLAEVADDHVTGTAFPADAGEAVVVTSWREIEVELVTGDEDLLAPVAAALAAAGAEPGRSPSKLARVLAGRLAAATPTTATTAPELVHEPLLDPAAEPREGTKGAKGKKGKKAAGKQKTDSKKDRKAAASAQQSAGDLIRSALADQWAALLDADLMVRTDQPDGVHQVRVSCRRLRSTLAAFRAVLVREETEAVRAELQWIGTQLSGSRDAEVAVAHLREVVAAQPPELVLGPIAARLQQEDIRDGAAGAQEAHRALAAPRYLQALDAVAALVADPPLTDKAADPADVALHRAVAHTSHRLGRAVEAAQDSDDPVALHDVRKAAKRLRYTAEVAAPLLGRPVQELLTELKAAQDMLGDRQDTFITREVCTQLGLQAYAAGENTWTYGRLHALEEARCNRAEDAFWLQWPQLRLALTTAAAT